MVRESSHYCCVVERLRHVRPLSLQDQGKAVERDRVAQPTLNPTRIKLPI